MEQTPKEKAYEIYNKFYTVEFEGRRKSLHSIEHTRAIANALIHVKEIMQICSWNDYKKKKNYLETTDLNNNQFSTWWQEVKQEIEIIKNNY